MTERRHVIIGKALEERDEAREEPESIGADGYCSFYRGIVGQFFADDLARLARLAR